MVYFLCQRNCCDMFLVHKKVLNSIDFQSYASTLVMQFDNFVLYRHICTATHAQTHMQPLTQSSLAVPLFKWSIIVLLS